MNIIMKDQSDKSWLKSAKNPVENYETHWNSPQKGKSNRFLFAALIMLCVFLFIFGNQLAKSNVVEKKQGYENTQYANYTFKNENEIRWPGNFCMAPANYDPRYQQHYAVPKPINKSVTVPEPGTTLITGLGLRAMLIKLKPRVEGTRMANGSRTQKIAAGDIEHRKTSIN